MCPENWLFNQQIVHLSHQITTTNFDWKKSGCGAAWMKIGRHLQSCQSNLSWGDKTTAYNDLAQARDELKHLINETEPGYTDKQQQEIARLKTISESVDLRLQQPWA